jgi:hypothetical protein
MAKRRDGSDLLIAARYHLVSRLSPILSGPEQARHEDDIAPNPKSNPVAMLSQVSMRGPVRIDRVTHCGFGKLGKRFQQIRQFGGGGGAGPGCVNHSRMNSRSLAAAFDSHTPRGMGDG